MNWIEWIGYLASAMVLVSIIMNSIVRLRWYNLIGSTLFGVYGLFIHAYPVAIVNFCIAIVNIYYLTKMSRKENYFDIKTMPAKESYIQQFLEFHKSDIKKFFPNFDYREEIDECFLLLRDMQVAGIFMGKRGENNVLNIKLDYLLPEYRDFKLGDFLFEKNKQIFLDKEYKILNALGESKEHKKYLERMGFVLGDNKYSKIL